MAFLKSHCRRIVFTSRIAPAARYRNQFMTEALSKELEYCQQAVQPLLGALQRTTAALPAAAGGDPSRLRLLLSSARLACRVFYSLNSPGLTEASQALLPYHCLLAHGCAKLLVGSRSLWKADGKALSCIAKPTRGLCAGL